MVLTAGKIHPQFGLAGDVTPGLHGTDVAEKYELKERDGGNVAYRLDILGIEHEVNVSAFMVDRTLLHRFRVLTSRGLSKIDDGGAGNSDGISSVAMSLDGCLTGGATRPGGGPMSTTNSESTATIAPSRLPRSVTASTPMA